MGASWSTELRKVAESQPGHQARLNGSLNTGMPLQMQHRGGPTPTIFFPPFSNNIFIPRIFSPGISLPLLSTQECQQPISPWGIAQLQGSQAQRRVSLWSEGKAGAKETDLYPGWQTFLIKDLAVSIQPLQAKGKGLHHQPLTTSAAAVQN